MTQQEVTVVLKGRTGNRFFQLAFLYAYSKKYNMKPVIFNQLIDPKLDDSLFQHFWEIFEKRDVTQNNKFYKIMENPNDPCLYDLNFAREYKIPNGILLFDGYIQTDKYFKDYTTDIRKLIIGNINECTERYFIHIRGGDYVNHPVHELKGINGYYEKCINDIGWDNNFLIFTDDVKYLLTFSFMQKLKNYKISTTKNEIDTLKEMAGCYIGGITANSSFSWWGSWLNDNPNKKVYMPKPWFPNTITNLRYEDIYYEGVKVVQI